MKLSQFKSKIAAYLDGTLPPAETNQLENWYTTVSTEESPVFEDNSHKDKIRAAILNGIQERVPTKTKASRSLKKYTWIAAAAVVLALLVVSQHDKAADNGFTAMFTSKNTLYQDSLATAAGQLQQAKLPDGTTIWLSGNAKIRFNQASFAKHRKIKLEQGEVFFDVYKDAEHPFVIENKDIAIQVLGTSFNVRRSAHTNQLSVAVKTGRVRVSRGAKEHVLTAGNTLSYQGNAYTLGQLNPDYTDLWVNGGLFIEQASFKDLQEIILNRFGLHLRSTIESKTFAYSLFLPKVESIDQLMEIICSIHQTKYRRRENEIILY